MNSRAGFGLDALTDHDAPAEHTGAGDEAEEGGEEAVLGLVDAVVLAAAPADEWVGDGAEDDGADEAAGKGTEGEEADGGGGEEVWRWGEFLSHYKGDDYVECDEHGGDEDDP